MRYQILALASCFFLGWAFGVDPIQAAESSQRAPQQTTKKVVLVIHGGSGVLSQEEMKREGLARQDYEQALARALLAGYQTLQQKDRTSVDAVEAAIRVMEDCELFNAGRGATFNNDGRAELDAAIMEGTMEGHGEGKRDPRKRAGAVAAVTHIKNPISAARAVMEMEGSRHVMLVGDGAERFALSERNRARFRIEEVSNLYFWTDRRLRQIRKEFKQNQTDANRGSISIRLGATDSRQAESPECRFGTVGAVACDGRKLLAAGTSTGGLTDKLPGRVGDSPIIGGGTYADNRACGVSCTGIGEVFIRHAVAHDVVARMLYGGRPVSDAVEATIAGLPDEAGGIGGLIALDAEGRHAFGMSKKCTGMCRGYVTVDGEIYVAIYAQEAEKRMEPGATTDRAKAGN